MNLGAVISRLNEGEERKQSLPSSSQKGQLFLFLRGSWIFRQRKAAAEGVRLG